MIHGHQRCRCAGTGRERVVVYRDRGRRCSTTPSKGIVIDRYERCGHASTVGEWVVVDRNEISHQRTITYLPGRLGSEA